MACLIATKFYGQAQTKLSTFLLTQYNRTLNDRTKGNNPWGIGLGLQTFLKNKTKFTPTLELTGNLYLEDDDVFRTNIDGTEIKSVDRMTTLFAGAAYNPSNIIYLSFVTGPTFINRQTYLGIKPSFGFYFSKAQKWTGKISYINIFNRDNRSKEDFSSLSCSIGLKLF